MGWMKDPFYIYEKKSGFVFTEYARVKDALVMKNLGKYVGNVWVQLTDDNEYFGTKIKKRYFKIKVDDLFDAYDEVDKVQRQIWSYEIRGGW